MHKIPGQARAHRFSFSILTAAALAGLLAMGSATASAASDVVISQVYGGGGNSGATLKNDFVELFNRGPAPVSVGGWSVQYASSTGTTWQVTSLPAVSLQPGQYLLVQEALGAGGTQNLPAPDAIGTIALSGTTGKVALVAGTAALSGSIPAGGSYLDLVGYGGASAFEGAGAAPTLSNTTAALRSSDGCLDSDNNGTDFAGTTPNPRNTASPLHSCAPVDPPIVLSCPASVNTAVGLDVPLALSATDADSIVNAASLTSVSPPAAGIALGSIAAAGANGGTASVNLNVGSAVPAGTYAVTVQFGNDALQSASCTVNVTVKATAASYTPIYTIQGTGSASPLNGSAVTTRGIVTKLNNNGYFLQDAAGDGLDATSDGIFVFTSTAPAVLAGQSIEVTGTVSEYNTGAATNAITLANPLTELGFTSNVIVLGTGSVAPKAVTLPEAFDGEFERYEGMLVAIATPLTASQNYFQGRYGQVTLGANGRLYKPTTLYRPGTVEALGLQSQNNRNSILLDDGSSLQNPNPIPYIGADNTLRAGDTIPAVTGVIDYGLATSSNTGIADWRIHPTQPPAFARANARPSTPPAVGGNVKLASFNVLNFFTTFTNGQTAAGQTGQGCAPSSTTADCRGADTLAEFNRQRDKIVAAMAAIGADVFGLMELQNNGNTAAQNLVDSLNATLGAGTYAVAALPSGGSGTDAIRVGLIYKPGSVTPVGSPFSDTDPIHNRPPLAQTFALANGQKFSVVVNHFKSKGCGSAAGADLDQGDGQGCYNDRRVQQSLRLLAFVGTVQAAAGDDDVLIVGDLNAYGQEDPVDTLVQGGLVNQVGRFDGAPYSYVFDGESGTLDYALATASLSAQVNGAAEWHINADEPSVIDYNTEFKPQDFYAPSAYRASDHDPALVGLNLLPAQAIVFGPLPGHTIGDPAFGVSAAATSGLPVGFSSLTPFVCTVSGATVTLVLPGTCTIAADQAGNAAWLPAPQVAQSFAVAPALLAQTVTFGPIPAHTLADSPFVVSATASSGLPVQFSSLTTWVCTLSGNTLALIAAGTCSIAADQPGDATYAAAPQVAQSFAVTAVAASVDSDVPLPLWSLLLLGAGLLGIARHRIA